MCTLLNGDMYQLRYRLFHDKWQFDKDFSHPMINVAGLGNRTLDKKSQIDKFCVGITNQPITPYNNDITFVINSQHTYNKEIVVGLCHRKTLMDMNF